MSEAQWYVAVRGQQQRSSREAEVAPRRPVAFAAPDAGVVVALDLAVLGGLGNLLDGDG